MTDRVHSITVFFEENIREDDAARYVAAFGLLRGVMRAQVNVADIRSDMAELRARNALSDKIMDLFVWPRK